MTLWKGGSRGSALLEGLISLGLFSLALVLAIELSRRGVAEVLVLDRAFWEVRGAVFREVTSRSWERRWKDVSLARSLQVHRRLSGSRCHGKAHVRFPALRTFPFRSEKKHHFEVTRQCSFPLSSF